ncbi:ferredoxin reductase family protein [Oceanobacter mangrovi]|uniref:ferredoxin reductase family protein n=1 Tax=Oceanobacter mangrovi TaxID=2862510 RepID=UPI001C8EF02F|nr:ferric reductase-like transmembrane domain-containing protein [Oceanobacter mangrovi]
MKAASRTFWGLLVLVSALWFLADSLLPDPFTYFSFRTVFVQYSGAIAIAVMSVAMMLAVRSRWLESRLNGLDKMYRLHKWLGISALVAATLHWWMAKGTKWMVGWGWLEKPQRGPRPEETLGYIEGLFRSSRGFAESVGEWAFYAAALLMVLALIKKFPYHLFKKTHTLLAIGYLALVFHSLVLIKFDYWTQPIGWLLALLMLGGSLSGIWILARQVGKNRRVGGEIAAVVHYPELRTVETSIRVKAGWPGHKAGQFAFVTTNDREGPHPFTIASAWDESSQCLTIISKALGDHTSRMLDYLKPGLEVEVEGPYGCFDFEDDRPHQIWIGAGIGITPFVARLQELAQLPGRKTVDLFHSTADIDENALAKLKADAEAAGVTLNLIVSGVDGRLTVERICQQVPDWQVSSVWFCGPVAFADKLKQDFRSKGFDTSHFHQELFQMR